MSLAAPARADWVRRITDGIMGTRITVELWADDRDQAEQAIDAVLDEMRHVDDSMSTYKSTSELSLVNAKAADGPMHISRELFDLLATAREYSLITDGAFDITYASVGYMYDFRKHVHPDEAQIDKALPAGVNFRHVLLDPKKQTVAVLAEGSADRSGRHRQGPFGGPRNRCVEIAGGSRGCMFRRAATAASSGIDSANPGWWGFAIRAGARER